MDEKKKKLASMLWLFFILLANAYVFVKNGNNLVNADDSSELVLASFLSKGNGFISRGWVYSSEIRILNTQWVRALLFRFTQNWTLVRILGNLILEGWLLGAYAFLCRQLTRKWTWFWYTAPFLLLPFSHEVFYVMGEMGYYLPHLALSFTILGLWLYLYREQHHRRIAHFSVCALSFVSCLGGLRQLTVTLMPMWLAVIWLVFRHSKEVEKPLDFLRKFYYLWTSSLTGVAGYLVNAKILSKIFLFDTYSKLVLVQPNFDRLQVVFRTFLNTFGYSEDGVPDTALFSGKGIFYVLSLGFMVFLFILVAELWKQRKNLPLTGEFLLLFSISGFLIVLLLYIFTDISITARYYALSLMMFVPLLLVFYQEVDLSNAVKKLFLVTMAGLLCILGAGEYHSCLTSTMNEGRIESAKWLKEEGYTLGYASFWNANILTELTAGQVEMVPLTEGRDSAPNLYAWLVKMDNLFPDEERGPVFLLLYVHEADRYQSLTEGRSPVYEDDNYFIYRYETAGEFLDLLNQE